MLHTSSTVSRPNLSNSLALLQTPQELHQLHSLLITTGFSNSPFFAGKLIAKYSHFGDTISSRLVFHTSSCSKNDVFMWNSLVRAHTHNAMFAEALDYYQEMRRANLAPDVYSFPCVIGACVGLGDVEMGRRVHQHVLEMGFEMDLYIGNSLTNMYTRFGCLEEARGVFDGMVHRDIVSWNSLISGYSANGEWEKAVGIYEEFRMGGLVPDCFTVESVLPAYGWLGMIEEGRVIHGLVNKIGLDEDRVVNNSLIGMYSRFGILDDAQGVFETMVGRDVVSWNTILDGYYQCGAFDAALELFREMAVMLKLDLVTITILLHTCHELRNLRLGSSVHGYIFRNGYECDTGAFNALMAMYSRCGRPSASQKVFDLIVLKDSTSWNSLISGYVEQGCFGEAIKLFKLMKESEVKPDFVTTITLLPVCTKLLNSSQGKGIHCSAIKTGMDSGLLVSNAVLNMYSKCNNLEDALTEFERMETRDTVSWNTIISGCVQNGDCNLGFKLLTKMRIEEAKMDMVTVLSILPACSFFAAKRQGKEIHGCALKLAFVSEVPVGNALIEMYSKSGTLDYAVRVFRLMDIKDLVTWTALVSAYGMYGQGDQALEAFEKMEEMGFMPDHVAFIALMFACSHAGLLEEGKLYFKKMEEHYKIVPRMEHYACMVDLLARSGELVEAESFARSMPIEPDISVWGSLLSACRISGETLMADRVAKEIIDLKTDKTGYYILASNVYASAGKWDEVTNVRKFLKARKLKKDPGYSWIEIRNRVYVFGTGDLPLEQSEEVYRLLNALAALMAKEGYIPDTNFVNQNVEEDDKRYMLCMHSERLAIAFGLLNTKPGTPLQIMKNLRVCGDCHTATKLISKIVQREFLVRDANRFHLFKEGLCSCGDHW